LMKMEVLITKNSKMSKQLIDRYFCHYEVLEEYTNGLWRSVKSSESTHLIEDALLFMRETDLFAGAMLGVCEGWANSCAFNFTNPGTNSVAWLGQASVCFSKGHPESITRAAWNMLEEPSQRAANLAARSAIENWFKNNVNSDQMDFFDGP